MRHMEGIQGIQYNACVVLEEMRCVALCGYVYTELSSVKLLSVRDVKKQQVLPTKSAGMDSSFSAGDTLPTTKLPPFIGGGFILLAGELSLTSKERLHSRPYRGTVVAAQLCHCKVHRVDISCICW